MRISAFAAAAALLGATDAQAACKLTTFEMPVTVEGLQPMVSVTVAGKPVKFILDSGAFFNALDEKFATEEKLKGPTIMQTGSHLQFEQKERVSGAGGTYRALGVVTTTLAFGGASFRMDFTTVRGLEPAAGLLGQNVLHAWDDEYDFKNGAMRLVRPNDCGSADLAYWVKPGMAYSVIGLAPTRDRLNAHTISTISINGVQMTAYFDTGVGRSFITARAAARAGVKTSDPGVRPSGTVRGVDRDDIKTWLAPFADIKIGDEEIKNTQLTIGDSQATDFDVLIGTDFFLAHRVYVANSQGKLYFSYVGGPIFGVAVREEPR